MPKRDVVPSPILDQLFFTHSPLFPRHSSPNSTHSYTLRVQYNPPIEATQTANSGIKNQCPKEKLIKLTVVQLSGLLWGHTQHNNRAAAGGYEVNK